MTANLCFNVQFWLCILSSVLLTTDCRTVTGVFNSNEAKIQWGQFLATFCFHGDNAQIHYELNSTAEGGKPSLYLFLDEDWAETKAAESCPKKLSFARLTHELLTVSGNLTVTHFQQPRTWHVVYVDEYACDEDRPLATLGERPVYIKYTIKLLNPDVFNNATDHFSDEESGIYRFYQLLTLGYFVLACIFCAELWETLQKGGPMNLVLQLLAAVLALQTTSYVLMVLHLRGYSKDGIGTPSFEFLTELMDVLSQFFMLYMMLSLSLGWSLAAAYKYHHSTLAQLKQKPAAKLIAAIGILQAVIFVWEQHEEREHRTYHAHRSISGAALVLVRLILAAIFALNLYTAVSKERSALKRNFYVSFTKCCMLWFLCYPCLLVFSWLLPPYMRYKFVSMSVVMCQSASVIVLYRLFISRSLYWEVSALSNTLPLRMDKSFGIKLYS